MRPQDKYNKEKTTVINVRLVKSTEADILAHLEKQENKSGYIKSLIRKDLDRQKQQG